MNTKLLNDTMFLLFSASTSMAAQPVITLHPGNQTASYMADATFRVSAVGDHPLSYQWRLNEAPLPGMTNSTLTITEVERSDEGRYSVVVTNASGFITSQVATLTMTAFNSIFFFGDSWTDTHRCAWDSHLFWQNRASNGPLWPELLSTNLGLVYLHSGNYARCGSLLADEYNQIGRLFKPPPKPGLSLYCLWGGAELFRTTNETMFLQAVRTFVPENLKNVDLLYARGARSILIENGQDWTRSPGFRTNFADLTLGSYYNRRWNDAYYEALQAYAESKPDLRIYWVDVCSKLNEIVDHPAQYGFTRSDIAAIPNLSDTSFTGPGANFVWWDGYHVTARMQQLLAEWHMQAITGSVLEKLELKFRNDQPVIRMNHLQIGRDYSLQRSPNLTTWQEVHAFTASSGTNQWSDNLNQSSATFFRLHWLH